MGKTNLRNFIGYIGWKIYVWGMWYRNDIVSKKLNKDVAVNLGYYLSKNEELKKKDEQRIEQTIT